MTRGGPWTVAVVCAAYLAIVFITTRGLIAAPRYRQFQGRLGDARTRARILAAGSCDDPVRAAELAAVTSRLDDLENNGTVAWRILPRSWAVAIPLSKLAAAWRVLHGIERRLLRLQRPEEKREQLRALQLRLEGSALPGDERLAAELARHPADGPEADTLLLAVAEHLHDREDTASEQEYEQQRTALWLATTGLGVALLIGVAFDHRLPMLLGALGGFLSPLIGVMRSQRPASWGVLVLAPVGGALAAVAGLLLVRMLADPELSVLGHVFLDNAWTASTRPVALAVALLFGFSGTLFSRLALTATGQLVSTPPATGQQP
ncbi:hypothetical protein [Streptomyces venezuelae]|uniref:hypothetical protein n=1 Tax=Streptomyces venezuelae TaxID=54571 RepID=UPI00123A6A91|nr:hypothetical protein [Streptomyces venezuelae]